MIALRRSALYHVKAWIVFYLHPTLIDDASSVDAVEIDLVGTVKTQDGREGVWSVLKPFRIETHSIEQQQTQQVHDQQHETQTMKLQLDDDRAHRSGFQINEFTI